MKRLAEVKPRANYRLWLRYDDGTEGDVDLSHLVGRGVFTAWSAPGVFERARLTASGGVSWGDEMELCPDSLYFRLTGARPEDVLPGLKDARVGA